jgi:hypothetical protein
MLTTLKRGVVAVGLVATVLALPATAFAGTSGGQGAQKSPMTEGSFFSGCSGPIGGTLSAHSFAIINLAGGTTVTVTVHVQKEAPNYTYHVLSYANGGCNPVNYDGDITTNGQGNGNLSTTFNDPTETTAFVVLWATDYSVQLLQSQQVSLS